MAYWRSCLGSPKDQPLDSRAGCRISPVFAELSGPLFPRATAAGSVEGVPTPPSNAWHPRVPNYCVAENYSLLVQKHRHGRKKYCARSFFIRTKQKTPNQKPSIHPSLPSFCSVDNNGGLQLPERPAFIPPSRDQWTSHT